jgi:orotate phosphoribosyltransferase-like protein
MNIDPSENWNANTYINFLGLQGVKVKQNISAECILTDSWEFAQNIWGNTKDTSFTDHGINHTIRIIKLFQQFSKIFNLDNYSICVFGIAALIHDIGMQYKYWCTDELYRLNKEGNEIFPNIHSIDDPAVRLRHCEFGFELIYHQIHNTENTSFIWNLCTDKNYKDILYQAMYIAFAHSSNNKYFEEMRTDVEKWTRYSDNINGYSPRLLACLLRICDELDCSIDRIDSNRLPASELNDYGYSQWLTCYFIHSSTLIIPEETKFYPYIEIQWQAPEGSTQLEREIIRNFLLTNRILKINAEILKVKNFLQETNEKGASFFSNLEIRQLDDKPIPSQMITIEKRKKSLMLEYTDKQENSINNTRQDAFINDNLPKELEISKKEIQGKINKWFFQNIDPKHYVLETSDHTNIFLNCRTLISNQELLREIGLFIAKYFAFMNQPIDCVLAVGTSAIPIAVNFQIHSGCKSTFTMSSAKEVNQYNHEEYFSSEIVPLIWESKNILIIDDIISIGDVTSTIVDNYLQSKNIEKIFHFALFRLGSRQIIKSPKITQYLWLSHIQWVYYWRDGVDTGPCKLCDEQLEKVYESKM